MNIKNFTFTVLLAIGCAFLAACNNSQKLLTEPEYMKTVVVQKSNFDDIIDNFLDQVEIYDGTPQSTERLNKLADNAEEFVTTLNRTLGPVVPEGSKEHYESMIDAYDMYIEGIRIYKENLPKELNDERDEAIGLAEKKFHDAQEMMMNIK